jgi:hypothetical protein
VKEHRAARFVSQMAAPAAKTLFSSGVTLRERGALLRSGAGAALTELTAKRFGDDYLV